MRGKSILGAAALIVLGILFGAVLVSGFGWVKPGLADVKLGADKSPVMPNAELNNFSQAFIDVSEKVTPSIVQINVVSEAKQGQGGFDWFPWGGMDDLPKESEGSGSGIIISNDGYILTNNHVVENAKRVEVILNDRRKFEAKVIGTDPLTDLGVIKINASNLPAAYLGNSDQLKVGQWVMAIGNPLSLSSTVTAGIISALNRGSLRLINDSYGVENFIQTDAVINPGNSGGALVDLNGAVIGVNTAIATRTGTYIGYGFAIPINLAQNVAKDLIANGKVSRGYIGVQIREVDAALAKSLGLDKPSGVIIEKIVEGGSASEADVKKGDVILKVDDKEVNAPNQLQSYVAGKTAGTKVVLTLWRDGKKIDRSVTLKPKGDDEVAVKDDIDNPGRQDNSPTEQIKLESIGLSIRDLKVDELKKLKIDNGVFITEVKPYSLAYNQGLGKGLVIIRADRKDISTVSELEKIISSKKGKAVLLEVADSQGNSRYVGIEVPD